MANCHDLFQKFYDEVKLTPSKEDSLKTAREAIREKIRNYFKNTMKENHPKFYGQGSYAMSTIINPLDGEYDIDDGIYLQNLDLNKLKWPVPETVHNWIYNAVKGHTNENPIDKRTCVRVIYSGQYHVDLPIYGMFSNVPYLAEREEAGWHVSDPRAVTDWFKNEVKDKGEQLRKVVRYLKAWKDNKSKLRELPSGLVLTILAVNNYEKSDRDDGSFAGTVRNIYNQMLSSSTILNPVDSSEHLSDRITESQMENFKVKLSTLLSNASEALKEDSKEKACRKWKKEFGDRFPKCEDLKENGGPLRTSAPALLRDDSRSA
ncbi:MAG: hypothetical protein CO162_00945 [bacterium (Candidatus Ratteibacteria) CG_4_9_14_3_um_filter_41_21]|uniref:Cyclic GMP-AMP synthase n=2 Tax=Candidatus Ratteibacteria TaxID=2979319 RepID=A0A2M7EAC7_9BACT|nr:MAG: hypothetical protein COS11_01095 [bacterium (Candidatus Ratteibacteria) CG01_land_8_20_14_3_00_40_19]PJA62458.1 MAG: hypothetical protein CO162_00945 [bacterium (Candidatus Ratteibacteria) CG_4_9_14_3_um_filter_41_21]